MGPLGDADVPMPGEVAVGAGVEPAASATPVDAVAEAVAAASAVALLEVLDRDGQTRQSIVVQRWPLRIGRALDNDLVLGDPHVAAHHLAIDRAAGGLELALGDTRNGVRLAGRWLRAHERAALDTQREAIEFSAGRTRLRLRLPDRPLAPELTLAFEESPARHLGIVLVAALLLIAGVVFTTYLSTDPDNLGPAIGNTLLGSLVGAAVWCGGWALLSKTFAHAARFGWHLRVFLLSGIALLAVEALPELLAFMFSWPVLTDFAFVGQIAVGAAALYFHLLAVEPGRRRLLRAVAVVCAAVGIGLSVWFNVQRRDTFGDELYMNHLFPPGLRLARPVSTDALVDGLAPLKAALDKKAKDPGHGDDGGDPPEDDE